MRTRSGLFSLIWKTAATAAIILLVVSLLPTSVPPANAAPAPASRFIAIVFDDSGSMREDSGGKAINNYIYANYSLQNLVALMDERDLAKVYQISNKGKNPITIRRQKNLYQAMKGIGAAPKGDTYAETVRMAMNDGAAFLKANQDGELLFVVVTDGASMYDEKGAEIKVPLTGLFGKYLKESGLTKYTGRSRALLLSIGPAKPLGPVTDLQSVLGKSGISSTVFVADVTNDRTAGDNIMKSMKDLAESMASTNMMLIEPGKPFTIRYPLQSLAIMEQFRQSSESTINNIEGDGIKLSRETLFTTKAIGGVKLASTFSILKADKGSIKPGQFTIQTNGDTKLMAFSRVGFTTVVSLVDGGGNEVASHTGGRWSVEELTMALGSRLSAKVTFLALDGSSFEVDPHVRMGFGQMDFLTCTPSGLGAFRLEAVKPGRDYLAVTLEDPDFFQIALPALPVNVSEPDPSASPSQSPTGVASATPNVNDTPAATANAGHDVLDGQGAYDAQYHVMAVTYTSSGEYVKGDGMVLGGSTLGDSSITCKGIPAGMQVRFNGKAFDGANASGTVSITAENNLELWINETFAAAGKQAIEVTLGDGQMLTVTFEAKPRQVKIELSPKVLSFGVMESADQTSPCGYRFYLMEGGQWVEVAPSAIADLRLSAPGGLSAVLDRKDQMLRVGPLWLPVLTPVGQSDLMLTAGTGKPGETASTALTVMVLDDWRKWITPCVALVVLLLLGAFVVKLLMKRRIPLKMEAYVAGAADLSDARPAQVIRRKLRRDLWPFGRESCTIGPLELYAHKKRDDRALLSNMAVQYGLTLDGKPPQFHKDRDEAGDFVLTSDTIVSVRVDGLQRYYRFVFPAVRMHKARKLGKAHQKR